jgi:predicted solute-binding protein
MHTLLITPYLNTRAFVHHGAPASCDLRALPPREAGPAIARGLALAGVVPVGGLAALGPQVELLGDYGISCPGPAQSVLFFSHRPFEELDDTDCVHLTTDSLSSIRLLYLLLGYRGGRRGVPRPARAGDQVSGELVIGDAALRERQCPRYPYVTDLAAYWTARHGLPMVFARWVVHRSVPRALRARLLLWLAAFAVDEARLLDTAAAEDHARTGLDAAAARDYLRGIRTVLKAEDLSGQALYLEELAHRPAPLFIEHIARVAQESIPR